MGFNRRFDPSFRDAYNKVRKGEIGQVQQVQSISRDSPLPPISYLRTSGGMFHDCCIHDIDLLTWVIGEFPTEVSIWHPWHCQLLSLRSFWPRPETRGLWKGRNGVSWQRAAEQDGFAQVGRGSLLPPTSDHTIS